MKKIYLIALLLAIITGVAVYFFGASLQEAAKPEEIKTVNVVVSTAVIDESVYITADMLTLKAVPEEYVAAGALLNVEDAVGKVNKFRCGAGQQIVYDQLGSAEEAAISEGGRLSYALEDGMRAFTIYVTEITGVAGYIMAGDRIDIISTMNVSGVDASGAKVTVPTSMMLLENIEVLETGPVTNYTNAEAASGIYTSVTVAVTSEESVELLYAINFGSISMLLRPVQDTETAEPEPYIGISPSDIAAWQRMQDAIEATAAQTGAAQAAPAGGE